MKSLGINIGRGGALLLLYILFAWGACTRKSDPLEPRIKAATNSFAIVDTLKANYYNGKTKALFDTISFSKLVTNTVKVGPPDKQTDSSFVISLPASTFFDAKFNEEVSWEIKITQKVGSNEAIKTIRGTSAVIDSTNSRWFGDSDGLTFFVQNAFADVQLAIIGSQVIDYQKVFIKYTTGYEPTQALLLNDFEGGFDFTPYGDDNDIKKYPAPDVWSGIAPPQGRNSLLISGTDNNGDYFVGGYQQPLNKGVLIGFNPSQIYINMYIYGFDPNYGLTPRATKLNISASEDDNEDGTFDGKFEDTFEKQISVDWVGWKLISIRYNDLIRSTSLDNGGNGNNLLEPSKAKAVSANLIASPNGTTVGTAVDYVILTFGKPYEK